MPCLSRQANCKGNDVGYVQRNAIALDQLFNTITGGFPDETFSARCGRNIHRPVFKIISIPIDIIFYPWQGPNHCVNAYKKEKTLYQFPKQYADEANQE